MSSLTLEVECLAGTIIKTCIEDALELCNKLGLAYVKFNFNGTEVHVGQNCNVSEAVEYWGKKGGFSKPFYVFNGRML